MTLSVTDAFGDTSSTSREVTVSGRETSEILAVESSKDEVNIFDDNIDISFQIYEESGIDNIESVEIWIKNENNRTENYDSWPSGNIEAVKNVSFYENTYSFVFNPDNSFTLGEASVIIRTTNVYGLETTERVEDLFEVTGEEVKVETENATDLKSEKATLNASIDYGDYSSADVTFYYREEDEEKWNNTGWETDYTSKDYSYELTDLKRDTVYEYRASVRYGDSGKLYDNGKIRSFHENLHLMLIQSEFVEATKGRSTVISLEVANLMSKSIEAVRIIPPQGYEITPSVRWIGSMDVDSYLSADFMLQTENLPDRDNLSFYALYRCGGETHKSAPLDVEVNLKEPERDFGPILFAVAVVIIAVVLGLYYWRWR